MINIFKSLIKYLFLLFTGGILYYLIEIIYRGYSSIYMILVGGICFILCGLLNNIFTWDIPLIRQMIYSSIIITLIEFISGLILNVYLKLDIWDYSNLPFNIMGQICIPFTLIWFIISPLAIILDDYIRYLYFDENKPHYTLLKRGEK